MSVPSFTFLGFAVVTAIVFHLLKWAAARQWLLLIINLVFLASFTHAPLTLLPLFSFLGFGYIAFIVLRHGESRLLAPLIVLSVIIFCWLKKYTFIPSQLWLSEPYLTIGLSYIFFRVLHIIIDAGQGSLRVPITPLSYLNYTLNFTCVVAGPIQTYPSYKRSWGPLTMIGLGRAVERVIVGFFKVMIVSPIFEGWQHDAIAHFAASDNSIQRIVNATLLIGLYPLFLYANFSGYTDVVIGVAGLFGLTLPENFNSPFGAVNFIEFWGRWHISLSSWLKTYVYNPLLMLMMRSVTWDAAMPFMAVIAFFVTFFLVGAWHGQTGKFLFFGVLQGGGVSLNKLYQILAVQLLGKKGYQALSARPLYIALCRGVTFAWFAFTMLWFWSTWPSIGSLFAALGWAGQFGVCGLIVCVGAAVILLVRIAGRAVGRIKLAGATLGTSRYVRTILATTLATSVIAYALLLNQAPPDIVYKAF